MNQQEKNSPEKVFAYSATTLVIACVLVLFVLYSTYRSISLELIDLHVKKLNHVFTQEVSQHLDRQSENGESDLPASLTKSSGFTRSARITSLGFSELTVYDAAGELIATLKSSDRVSSVDETYTAKFQAASAGSPQVLFKDPILKRLWNQYRGAQSSSDIAAIYFIPIGIASANGSRLITVAAATQDEFTDKLDSLIEYFLFLAIAIVLLVSIVYYWVYSAGKSIIDRQNATLQSQIIKLRNTVAVNQGMQKNMRTASSRAVELNERFLRRVGADLHDGPAQTIGYAILRLDHVNQETRSKQFNQEYHTVKDALTNALNEIRAISSGLVLPELEGLTLEATIEKVVELHEKNTGMEVKTYYQDVPETVPFPIMICTYRFIQEALNNAHRHGNADVCRIIVNEEDSHLIILLKDNGRGFRAKKQESDRIKLGLAGLVDRIESIGGELDIMSQPNSGVTIKVSLPIYSQ